MYDRRVARGSTYAAMVIPAGTNPDAMMMERKQEERKKKAGKAHLNVCTISVITYDDDDNDNDISKYSVYNRHRLEKRSTPTEISQPLSPFLVVSTWIFRLKSTLSSSLTSLLREKRVLQLSFTSTGPLYHSFSLVCLPSRIASTLKSMVKTLICSTLTPQWSLCWLCCAIRHLSRRAWKCSKKKKWEFWNCNSENMKKLEMQS